MTLQNAYIIKKNKKTRHTHDYYATAPLATRCLLALHGDIIPKDVWEPAAGRGWISQTLQEYGRTVISTDLYEHENPLVPIETGQDYLLTSPKSRCIITNPPYKSNLAFKFAEKAVSETDYTALFVRLTFMESYGRYGFFKQHPPNVLVFSGRMQCDESKFDTHEGQLGGMVAYAWFVWSKNLPGNHISWIDPRDHIPRATLQQFTQPE